ncbi:UDP-glycosyltransferase BMGT2 [Striga asiatica]|uniref:UDP-glycosyltransferase BMGT2 n=1 Tax=Striga asiatica TaxID=4170 RepID=A0A5A7R1Q9_STRAF|nr:UDP-glycosyltransferase BMGT2 [Striga asiatica]
MKTRRTSEERALFSRWCTTNAPLVSTQSSIKIIRPPLPSRASSRRLDGGAIAIISSSIPICDSIWLLNLETRLGARQRQDFVKVLHVLRRLVKRRQPGRETLHPANHTHLTCDRVVLEHAVARLVTHCGRSSILEVVMCGMPMIGWPTYAEQKMNRVFMVEKMGVALPLDDGDDEFRGGGGAEEICNFTEEKAESTGTARWLPAWTRPLMPSFPSRPQLHLLLHTFPEFLFAKAMRERERERLEAFEQHISGKQHLAQQISEHPL